MASRFSERGLKSLKISFDRDDLGKAIFGNDWSSITSTVKVEAILIIVTCASRLYEWNRAMMRVLLEIILCWIWKVLH
jgi:hypothetical protein